MKKGLLTSELWTNLFGAGGVFAAGANDDSPLVRAVAFGSVGLMFGLYALSRGMRKANHSDEVTS